MLGLGDIGPRAAMPVMEGKAMLFKEFAGVDAFPICLDTHDPDEIVAVVRARARIRRRQPRGHLGAAVLRDRAAAEGSELDIPVFHDDQHGTAVVVLAALLNALRLTGRRLADMRIVIVGMGAAGVAVTQILLEAGARHIIGCDSRGALSVERADYLDGSDAPGEAGAGLGDESGTAVGECRGRARRRRSVHRAVGRAGDRRRRRSRG